MGLSAAGELKVAVLLNANAKRFTRRVHNALRHVVPDDDLFLSRTAADARDIARTVVDRRYPTVFTGGGDGTFVSFVTEILDFVRTSRQALPRFGVLKLGTGNALAGMVGATAGEGILDDVLRARAGEVPSFRSIDLLEAEGRITPFAGLGLDAAVLNDYVALKKRLAGGRFQRFAMGAPGYALAIASRTLPHHLFKAKTPEIEVICGDGHAALLGPDGKPIRSFAPGEVLYRGPAAMCAASTVPFYGFDFKMFPFVGVQPGRMQLRIANLKPLQILANLNPIWAGRYRHPEIRDFLAEKIQIRSSAPVPFQIGGDAEGYREEVTLSLSSQRVELVDYSGPLN